VGTDLDGALYLFRVQRGGWRNRVLFRDIAASLEEAPAYLAKNTGWPVEDVSGAWAVEVQNEDDYVVAPAEAAAAAALRSDTEEAGRELVDSMQTHLGSDPADAELEDMLASLPWRKPRGWIDD
jgi:hypothetical protein